MEYQRVYGLNNEDDIINYLNGKKFSELNQKWQEHIKYIFNKIKDDDIIWAKHYYDKSAKPDMVLELKGKLKYVSIKTGKDPAVHHESYVTFRRFLAGLGISERTLKIIQFFHYGDSRKATPNGIPLTADELKEKYMPYFVEASKEMDQDPILRTVIRRTVIQGTNPTNKAIDFLYYGDLEHGRILSLNDIYSFITAYRNHDKCAIHFGGLNYHPNSRSKFTRERNYVRIRWPHLSFLYYVNDEEFEKLKAGTF